MTVKFRVPTSATGRSIMRRRHKVYFMTGGLCFYCAGLITCDTIPATRDWLLTHPRRHDMACEHKTPTIRGGEGKPENFVPSCRLCNTSKGAFTIDEFRFIRGLQEGNLDFRFPFEAASAAERDWLCSHSPDFAATILLHNLPAAVAGFEPRRKDAREHFRETTKI